MYVHSYKKISLFDKIHGCVPRIAVTTTVTDKFPNQSTFVDYTFWQIVEDICKVLTLRTPKVFRMAVQQIRVHCDIQFLDTLPDPFEHLKKFIVKVLDFADTFPCKVHDGYAIVYCREELATKLIRKKLSDSGISTLACHHRLTNSERHNIEYTWISGNAQVITTTRDYGFIHKQHIRCIAYWTIPENIPKYYRECAQMYTKSDRAYSRIYFSVKEYSSVRLVLKNHREITEKNCLSEYDKLVSYCLSITCRHTNIHKYFGHVIPPCKMNCDVCKNKTVVEDRTHMFITRSKEVDGVTYNICKINENLKNKRTTENDKQKPKSTSNGESEKEIPTTRHKLPESEEKPRPDESSSQRTQLSIRVDELAITPSLADKNNLNKEAISLEPCSTKNSTFKDSERRAKSNPTCSNGRGLAVGSRIRHAYDDGKIKKSEKCHVSKSDSCEIIVVFENLRKGSLPEEFKSKKRKLETENKLSNKTRINRNEGADDRNRRRVERIKGDANEGVTCDLATADYLMNKYKLNKDAITLEPRRK